MPFVFNPFTGKFDSVSDTSGFLKRTGDTATGDYIFDGGTIKIDSTSHEVQVLFGRALKCYNGSYSLAVLQSGANSQFSSNGNLQFIAGAGGSQFYCANTMLFQSTAGYVHFIAGPNQNQYSDAGGFWYWRDTDASSATRMTLDSSLGALSVYPNNTGIGLTIDNSGTNDSLAVNISAIRKFSVNSSGNPVTENNIGYRSKRVDGTLVTNFIIDTNNDGITYIPNAGNSYIIREPGGNQRFAINSYGQSTIGGTTVPNILYGLNAEAQPIVTANNQTYYNLYLNPKVNVQTYTGLTGYGAYIAAQTKTGAGTIDNYYQLAIDTPTIGTNNFVGRFGNATNNTTIEADGTVKFNGAATVYDDLLGDITQVKTLGTGVTSNNTENSLDYAAAATTTDYAYINYQMSHKWKAGSDIKPHIHWEQNQNATPNWLIQYRWQRNGQTKTTSWTNYKCNTNVFTYTSGTINQISYGVAITPPTGYSLSDIIQFRIIRDTGNVSTLFTGADAYTGVASMTSADNHLEIDTIGSRSEYTK